MSNYRKKPYNGRNQYRKQIVYVPVNKSSTDNPKDSQETAKPTTAEPKPTTVAHTEKPTAKPDTTNDKPTKANDKPITTNDKPTTTNDKATTNEKPTTTSEKPTTPNDKPTTSNVPAKIVPIPSKEKDFQCESSKWFDESEFLKGLPKSAFERHSDYYFGSYSHFYIHENMLKDKVRTGTYRQACQDNADLFAGKTVLDIGCGTGILSIFSAKAGAKKVYGVDNAHIADYAKVIVKDNELSDKIEIIKGDIKTVKLPVEKVDILISEWMGNTLLSESMLDDVLLARDKYLTKDGIMMPDRARMRIAAISDGRFKKARTEFWKDVYGVDMSIMTPSVFSSMIISFASKNDIISNDCTFADFDLYTVNVDDLTFAHKYSLTIERNAPLNVFVIWFDVMFGNLDYPVELSTGPRSRRTHWENTILHLPEDIKCKKGDVITGTVGIRKNPRSPRDLDIILTVNFKVDGQPCRKKYLYR